MKLSEIKKAVENGIRVFWKNENYEIVKDAKNQWFIRSASNNHYIGLTHADGETMNGNENDFFTERNPAQPVTTRTRPINQDTQDFLETVLWVERFEDGSEKPETFDKTFSDQGCTVYDFHPAFINAVENFLATVADCLIEDETISDELEKCERSFGGNVFLSQSGHGAGFFDESQADGNAIDSALVDLLGGKYRFEEINLMIHEDGKIDCAVLEEYRTETRAGLFYVLTDERKAELSAELETLIDSQVEYQTEHEDSGNDYHVLLTEGSFCYGNGETRLRDFLRLHEIETVEGFDMESLADDLIDCADVSSEHIFSTIPENVFELGSFPVGEIEIQICARDFAETANCPVAESIQFLKIAVEENDFCLREGGGIGGNPAFYAYVPTDCFWSFRADMETVKMCVLEENEAARERAEYQKEKAERESAEMEGGE